MKIYCEHGALSKQLRTFQNEGRISLVHFPYDPNSKSKHLSTQVVPSAATQFRDMHCSWDEVLGTWAELKDSVLYTEILSIIGKANRRDALHVDTAYKAGCAALVTVDNDILNHKVKLEQTVGMRIFHPVHDEAKLVEFILAATP